MNFIEPLFCVPNFNYFVIGTMNVLHLCICFEVNI